VKRVPHALVFAFTLAACAPNIPRPTELDVDRAVGQRPGTTLAELDRGRTLYVGRCGGCHSLYAPTTYAPVVWREKVSEMRQKAKLGTDDEQLIVLYLSTLSMRGAK